MPRRHILPISAILATLASAAAAAPVDPRLAAEAARVTVTRDDWGIAHVAAPTDALAVFGGIYAQAEDDFNRVETNYITNLGRTAEVEGEGAIWGDLRQRLFIDPADLKAKYAASPVWLKRLMDGWADGLNYYLSTHPATKPRLITHFEPWMTLAFSEGSIGGDIEDVDLKGLAAFYGGTATTQETDRHLLAASNGMAIAPALTKDGHALLLINPHTSFFFRSELQMTSGEGLNVYGASTWGQFFIYQGFNAHAGWMHTSSGVNNVDFYAETVVRHGDAVAYRYGAAELPMRSAPITLSYRGGDGATATRTFTAYFTRHGPIVRREGDKWVAVALMQKPVAALEQSFLRTKASDLTAFRKVGELRANSSNNTLFADDKGEIAYLHPQFIPVRDDRFDYTTTLDGADPATDWHGDTPFDARPNVLNPANGWVYNSNDWPYAAAGPDSPKQNAFPRYMDTSGETPRGVHAAMVLTGGRGFTVDTLIKAAFDPYLPEFGKIVPGLARAYDALPADDPRRARLAAPVAALQGWDRRWSAESTPTSLAVYWGETLAESLPGARPRYGRAERDFMETGASDAQRLAALDAAVGRLTADFGDWRVAWGRINRFQRVTDAIAPAFDDAAPSQPVPFVSNNWGSLATFETVHGAPLKMRYGVSGNSFVAAVEVGPRVRARAVSIGGESGDPASRHFADQVERYAKGDFRAVYFYPEDLKAHAVRTYHPGE